MAQTSRLIGGAYVKEGIDSPETFADSLHDKIINLKFIRKTGRSFSIRSDYEPVFHKDGVSFKPCVEKPDIKITYKQVAESVAIEVDIEIVNFTIGDAEKETEPETYAAGGDPITWCVVQMGYRNQFPDWRKLADEKDVKQFYDLNNHYLTSKDEVFQGKEILVQILTGYPTSYPPDKTIYFKGIIGTMDKGLKWGHKEKDFASGYGYGEGDFPEGLTEIEEVLYQFVTRRFVRPDVLHITEVAKDEKGNVIVDENDNPLLKIRIYGKDKYVDIGKTARLQLTIEQTSSMKAENKWEDVDLLGNGIMTVADADKFGVVCTVSETLKRHKDANKLYGYAPSDAKAALMAALRPIPNTPFMAQADTLGGQLVKLQQHYPFLRWYLLADGSYYFYHDQDTDKHLWSDPFVKTLQKERPTILPAIYDMTPAGTRTIRCPFIGFISPMMTVLFHSRHSLGTMTSFFYPVQTNAFLVIIATIEFATVQEANQMEMMCVDLPAKTVKILDDGTIDISDEKKEEPKESGVQVKTADEETPEEVPVEAQTPKLSDTAWSEYEHKVVRGDSWANIVSRYMVVMPHRWPEDGQPDEKRALEDLAKWNPQYFDESGEYMKRGSSVENDPGGIGSDDRTGIKVAWLKPGDIVIIRHPFQPEYPPGDKI